MIQEHDGVSIADPSMAEVRVSLERVIGADFDALWSGICSEARVTPDADTVSDDEFDAVIDAMCRRGSVSRVIGMSWRIRRTAARKLAELGR